MTSPDDKDQFLNNEFWVLTFGGGFQRSRVYDKDVDDNSRVRLRGFIRTQVEKLVAKQYSNNSVSERAHIKNLVWLKNSIDREFGKILTDREIKLGVVQKILNLYLKYHWCLGTYPEPPHCPFDRIIIGKLGIKNPPNWTEINTPEEYQLLANAAKNTAHPESISNWELKAFARRSGS